MDDLKHPFKPVSYKGNLIIGIIDMLVVILWLVVNPHQWGLMLIFFLNGIIFIISGLLGKKKAEQDKTSK